MNLLRALLSLCIVAIPAVASAQWVPAPGSTPAPGPAPWAPSPTSAQWTPAAPGSTEVMDPTLSEEDRRLLERGEYTTDEIIGGGLVGTFFGFGVGHAVQGRYLERGWIFTAGELGSLALTFAWIASCTRNIEDDCSAALPAAGMLGMFAFRIWELVDVWRAPAEHNRKVQRARARAQARRVSGYVAPTGARSAVVGLSLEF